MVVSLHSLSPEKRGFAAPRVPFLGCFRALMLIFFDFDGSEIQIVGREFSFLLKKYFAGMEKGCIFAAVFVPREGC